MDDIFVFIAVRVPSHNFMSLSTCLAKGFLTGASGCGGQILIFSAGLTLVFVEHHIIPDIYSGLFTCIFFITLSLSFSSKYLAETEVKA